MTCRVSHTSFNCRDAFALSTWWKQVLGYIDVPDDPNEPGDEECMIVDPSTGHQLLFIEVGDLADVGGRVHLDLAPMGRRRDDEIERVLALGAEQIADRRNPDGTGWMVLADIEDNQFCIVRSDEERPATQ
jgi:catechol 2,3-dioxygenase-like lactoylglutathione lyase family enzyme